MSDQSARELEEKLAASLDAIAKAIKQNRRIVAVRPLAKQIIVTDRQDEEGDEEEEE